MVACPDNRRIIATLLLCEKLQTTLSALERRILLLLAAWIWQHHCAKSGMVLHEVSHAPKEEAPNWFFESINESRDSSILRCLNCFQLFSSFCHVAVEKLPDQICVTQIGDETKNASSSCSFSVFKCAIVVVVLQCQKTAQCF